MSRTKTLVWISVPRLYILILYLKVSPGETAGLSAGLPIATQPLSRILGGLIVAPQVVFAAVAAAGISAKGIGMHHRAAVFI